MLSTAQATQAIARLPVVTFIRTAVTRGGSVRVTFEGMLMPSIKRYKLLLVAVMIGLLGPPLLYYLSITYRVRFTRLFSSSRVSMSANSFFGVLAYQSEYRECGSGCAPREVARYIIAVSPSYERADEYVAISEVGEPHVRIIQGRGRWVSVYPEVNAYFGLALQGFSSMIDRQLNPADACGSYLTGNKALGAKIGDEVINGYQSVIWQLDSPSAVATRWLAPDLGCFELQSRTYYKAVNDSPAQTVLRTTTSLQIGDPGKDWFGIPAGLDHKSPSEVVASTHAKRHTLRGRSDAEIAALVDKIKRQFAEKDRQWESRKYLGQ